MLGVGVSSTAHRSRATPRRAVRRRAKGRAAPRKGLVVPEGREALERRERGEGDAGVVQMAGMGGRLALFCILSKMDCIVGKMDGDRQF